MEPAPGTEEREQVALRRCLPCSGAALPPPLRILRLLPDGREVETETRPFPPGSDPAACASSLADIEGRMSRNRIHYELCVTGLGVVRTTKAGWLARLAGRRNFPIGGSV